MNRSHDQKRRCIVIARSRVGFETVCIQPKVLPAALVLTVLCNHPA